MHKTQTRRKTLFEHPDTIQQYCAKYINNLKGRAMSDIEFVPVNVDDGSLWVGRISKTQPTINIACTARGCWIKGACFWFFCGRFTMVYPTLTHASSSMNWTSRQCSEVFVLVGWERFSHSGQSETKNKNRECNPPQSSTSHSSIFWCFKLGNTYFDDKQTCMLRAAIDSNNPVLARVQNTPWPYKSTV